MQAKCISQPFCFEFNFRLRKLPIEFQNRCVRLATALELAKLLHRAIAPGFLFKKEFCFCLRALQHNFWKLSVLKKRTLLEFPSCFFFWPFVFVFWFQSFHSEIFSLPVSEFYLCVTLSVVVRSLIIYYFWFWQFCFEYISDFGITVS